MECVTLANAWQMLTLNVEGLRMGRAMLVASVEITKFLSNLVTLCKPMLHSLKWDEIWVEFEPVLG